MIDKYFYWWREFEVEQEKAQHGMAIHVKVTQVKENDIDTTTAHAIMAIIKK